VPPGCTICRGNSAKPDRPRRRPSLPNDSAIARILPDFFGDVLERITVTGTFPAPPPQKVRSATPGATACGRNSIEGFTAGVTEIAGQKGGGRPPPAGPWKQTKLLSRCECREAFSERAALSPLVGLIMQLRSQDYIMSIGSTSTIHCTSSGDFNSVVVFFTIARSVLPSGP
jgi:hypothetical protein